MIFVSLLCCCWIFWLNKTPNNVLIDPFTVFFIALLYYGFLVPICMVIFSDYLLPLQGSGLIVDQTDLNMIAILLTLGYAAFVLGFRKIVSKHWVDEIIRNSGGIGRPREISLQRFLIVLSIIVFTIIVVFYFDSLIAIFSGYADKIETKYSQSTFSLLFKTLLTLLTAYAATKVLYSRNYIVFSSAFVVGLSILAFLTFSKDPFVYAAIFSLTVGVRALPKQQLKTLLIAIGIAALVLVFVIPAFSAYRSTGTFTFNNPAGIPLAYIFSDASGPFSSIILALHHQAVINVGPIYESLILWIPRTVWPNRPFDASEAYAQAVMLDWQPGFGLGFSPFAEAYFRYGIIFAPFLFFLMGIFMGAAQAIIAKRLPLPTILGIIFVVQGYTLFNALRGPVSGLPTAMAQFWIPFFIAAWAFGLTRRTEVNSINILHQAPANIRRSSWKQESDN